MVFSQWYLYHLDLHPATIIKVDRLFGYKLNFEDIKFEIFAKLKKRILLEINNFGHKNKEIYLIYVSKENFEGRHIDLFLIEEKDETHYVLIENFNTFKFIHYIAEEIIYVVIVYRLLVQKKH